MKELLKELLLNTKIFIFIMTHLHRRKSNGSDGIQVVLPRGLGDAVLFSEYVEELITFCQKNSKKLMIVTGKVAKYFLTDILKLPKVYFSETGVDLTLESEFPAADIYKNYEFDAIFSERTIFAAGCKAKYKASFRTVEELKAFPMAWNRTQYAIYDDVYIVPQEEWILKRYQMINNLLGTPNKPTRIPELRERIVKNKKNSYEKYIVFGVDSSSPTRRWPNDNFIRLIRCIHDKYGYTAILAGVKGNAVIQEAMKDLPFVIDLCGKTSLEELIDVVAYSEFTVSVDSALVHLTAALGVQAFAICGHFELSKYVPYHPEEVSENYPLPICVQDDVDKYFCRGCVQIPSGIKANNKECYKHCYHHGGSMLCLENVTVERVLDSIEKYIKGK